MRIRFTTSHPQDLSDKLLYTIAGHSNLCNYIHLPVQSGSNRILELMNRTYSIEHYLTIIDKARKIIPGVSFSTDIIAGFPTESDKDNEMTLDVMKIVRYDGAFMFKYSPREGTKAFSFTDDVPEEIKAKRLNDIIELQQSISYELNQSLTGTEEIILVEGSSKKSEEFLFGRTGTNKIVIFQRNNGISIGDYIKVKINRSTSATLFGDFVELVNPANKDIAKTA
jgi:tRNA-2-methylthio-N6-dimethylallyladenosine synthase